MKDENIQAKIQEILIKGKNFSQEADSCELFVYQPENIEEIKLGSLFFVGKIDSNPEATHIINLLTSIIKREYYFNRRRKALASLEASLKKANAAILELTKKETLKWVNKINFICVALIKNQLHFTALGQTKALLLRGGRLTDLTKKLVPAQEKINPKKPFQSIASGKVLNNDKIILTTSDIFQYIPQKGLRQILELGQIGQLQAIIKENENIPAQGLIIIDLVPEKELPAKKPTTITFQEQFAKTASSSRLPKKINQQLSPFRAKTEEIISDINLILRNYLFKARDHWKFSAIKIKLQKKPAPSFELPLFQNAKTPANENLPASLPDKEFPQADLPPASRLYKELDMRQSENWQKRAFSIIRKLLIFIEKILRMFFLTAGKLISAFKNAPLRQKRIYLLALAALILISVGSRYSLAYKYQKESESNDNLAKISEEKFNEINKIASPPFFSQETSIPANNFNFLPSRISISANNFLLATTNQKSNIIYSLPVAPNEKTGNFIPTDLPQDINWLAVAANKNSLILLAENNEFYEFNLLSKTSSRLALTLPAETKAQDMVIFNNNIYLLDSQNSQIIKCANLANCQSWLKEKNDLSNAVSLAIDGSVYVLSQNGEISQYFNGVKKESIQSKLRPFSNDFFKIQASQELQNIYLADKTKKRIAIIDKNGQLIKQYIDQGISNIEDFQVGPDEKTIFILADEKIYKINN